MAAETVNDIGVEMLPTTTLMGLNEHCLLKILEFLSLEELVPVAYTCKQLMAIAHRVAKIKYIDGEKNFNMTIHYSFNESSPSTQLLMYRNCMRIFGDLIKNVKIRVRSKFD